MFKHDNQFLALCTCLLILAWTITGPSRRRTIPAFEKPGAMTMAELSQPNHPRRVCRGGNRLRPGHYTGAMSPSPPHADLNAREGRGRVLERPSRRLSSAMKPATARWSRAEMGPGCATSSSRVTSAKPSCSTIRDGKSETVSWTSSRRPRARLGALDVFLREHEGRFQPRLRGTEDYFAYPNGLVLRRMTYESLMPDGRSSVTARNRSDSSGCYRQARSGEFVFARRRAWRLPCPCRARPLQRSALRHLLG